MQNLDDGYMIRPNMQLGLNGADVGESGLAQQNPHPPQDSSQSAQAQSAASQTVQQQQQVTIPFPTGQDSAGKPARKRARKSFHRPSAAETYLDQQQGVFDDDDEQMDVGGPSPASQHCSTPGSGVGGTASCTPIRVARDAWFQPKWVPGPLFAVRDVLQAFPSTAPASEEENPNLVRAEQDPRFNLEDLRALSYEEYIEDVISSASGDSSKQLKEKYLTPGMSEERRIELGLIPENDLSQTVAVRASDPVGDTSHFLPFKMVALEAELAVVRVGGKEYLSQSEGGIADDSMSQEVDRPGRRRSRGRETKQARSYQRITSILKDESYFGPTEPVSSSDLMSAARVKMLYESPGDDVIADARMLEEFDKQHVPDMVPEGQNEIVMRVTFYSKRFAKDQEFLVLGSQPLVVLRDAITCAVDGMMSACEKQQQNRLQEEDTMNDGDDEDGHASKAKDNEMGDGKDKGGKNSEHAQSADERQPQPSRRQPPLFHSDGSRPVFFKSASFLIENVFHNDMRDPRNADYSAPILEWVEERRKELHIKCEDDDPLVSAQHGILGPYRVEDMSRVRFDQLFIRIGSIYSFLHQADCEHRFMFSDVRLLGPGEDHDRSNYPLLLTRTRLIRTRCDICSALVSSRVTCNDAQAPCSPCHWCQHCYDAFHLNEDGSLAYTDFQTLPYVYENK